MKIWLNGKGYKFVYKIEELSSVYNVSRYL